MNNSKTVVAIQCLVYNHEPYLRDCLNGFVNQQTNFPFVAIVHDDASTDNSASIIREFAEKYPDIICPIYETENQWRKPDGSLMKIVNSAINATNCKYVAYCEGDDYWIDPYKLQKQVDFLEANPDFAICFHPVIVLNQQTGEKNPDNLKDVASETTILDLVAEGNYIHSPSIIYRRNKEADAKFRRLETVVVGDYLRHVLYAEHGKIKKLSDYMAVYRHGVGIWTGPNVNQLENSFQWLIALAKLSSLLEDSQTRRLLDKQIFVYKNELIDEWSEDFKKINKLQTSKAYRLGRSLLKPVRFIKRLLRKEHK